MRLLYTLAPFSQPSSRSPSISMPCKRLFHWLCTPSLAPVSGIFIHLTNITRASYQGVISVLSGEIQTAAHYTSIASRLLMAAGAHAISSTESSNLRQHLRSLFWFCYTLDKDLTLRTGEPHCLRDDDCNLDLPPRYEENLHQCLDYSPGAAATDISGPIFPCDIRLSMIKSRTFTVLYSRNALHKSDVDLLRSVRELDEELECWRTSIPEHLRPQLCFSSRESKTKSTFMVLTHMSYYCCVNLIHLAGSRCSAWRSKSPQVPGMIDGLQSSLAISVEASRSLLLYLEDSKTRVDASSFWYTNGPPKSHLYLHLDS